MVEMVILRPFSFSPRPFAFRGYVPPRCFMGQACLATHLTYALKGSLASPPNWRARRAALGEGEGGIGWRLRLYMDTLNYTPSPGERDGPPPLRYRRRGYGLTGQDEG